MAIKSGCKIIWDLMFLVEAGGAEMELYPFRNKYWMILADPDL